MNNKDCWLKRRREELDMSQHDVAIKLGMTAGAIGQWERLKSAPPVRISGHMAAVYQCSVERIIEAIAEIVRLMDEEAAATTSSK